MRVPAPDGRRKVPPPERFACPTGWVRNKSLVTPGPLDAAMMVNLIPTASGCRARGGANLQATLGSAGTFLASYDAGEAAKELIAATETALYHVSNPASSTSAPTPELFSFTSGDWAAQQYTTAGGTFLWMVNGTDSGLLFDGTDWNPVGAATIYDLDYDDRPAPFTVGDTITGGTSGAIGVIRAIAPTADPDVGTLKITVTSGTFQDNETVTGAISGVATVDGTATSALANTVTNVDTADLSHVWTHGQRLWFIEKDTLNAWYLGAGNITGAATAFPMYGIFQSSSALLFGSRLSNDSGDGPDDRCVFVTTDGEVAVYTGTDPSSASTWNLEGVYRIPRPLGKRAFTRAGGDLLIGTEAGFVSVLQVMARGPDMIPLSFDIEDYWLDAVTQRTAAFSFSATAWHDRSYLLIGVPAQTDGQAISLVMNTTTKRWAELRGWDVQHSALHNGRLYIINGDGQVLDADRTGTDIEAPYYSILAPMFRSGVAGTKYLKRTRVIHKGAGNPVCTILTDFDASGFRYPVALTSWVEDGWGSAIWGQSLWGSAADTVSLAWQRTLGHGYSFTPAIVAGWGSAETPSFEPIVLEVLYEIGNEI